MITAKQIALIHIAKKQLGLDDLAYRHVLRHYGGPKVSSCKHLDKEGVKRLLAYFKSCGFKQVHKSAKKSGMDKPPAADRLPQLKKIEALIADMDLSWAYADGIAKRMYKRDRVRFCTPDQLRGVIAALTNHAKAKKAKQAKQDKQAADGG